MLLSTRDPERWWKSVNDTIYPATRRALQAEQPLVRAFAEWADRLIQETVFQPGRR